MAVLPLEERGPDRLSLLHHPLDGPLKGFKIQLAVDPHQQAGLPVGTGLMARFVS